MNSACLSTNRSMSHGQATRSTRGCSRVIHFTICLPVRVLSRGRRLDRSVRLRASARDESVPTAGDRLDVSRLVPVVLQLGAEGTHVAVDDVALDDEVGTPERVEDLLAREDAPRIRGKEVQQGLLERRQMQLVIACEDLSVEHVDLEIADPKAWHELPGLSVSPADDRARARDQVVWNEGDSDVVVGAALKSVELPAKVAPASQGDHADRPSGPRLVD